MSKVALKPQKTVAHATKVAHIRGLAGICVTTFSQHLSLHRGQGSAREVSRITRQAAAARCGMCAGLGTLYPPPPPPADYG